MPYSLSLSEQASSWLETHPDRQRVSRVARWIRDELCDDDAEIPSVGIQSPWGRRFEVSEVPGEAVGVCWFDAAPFRTIKVMWIAAAGEERPDLTQR